MRRKLFSGGEVMEPASLRKRVKDELKKSLHKY